MPPMLLMVIGTSVIGVRRFIRSAARRTTAGGQLKKRPSQSRHDQEGQKGGGAPLVAIIWPCSLSPSSHVAAGKSIVVPALRCPTCQAWLMNWGGYWRWLRAPLLIERIWIRRGRCGVCRRTHALLPDLVLARRLDEVAVIGRGILRAAHDRSHVVATFPSALANVIGPLQCAGRGAGREACRAGHQG
jgi:hypothetical protein